MAGAGVLDDCGLGLTSRALVGRRHNFLGSPLHVISVEDFHKAYDRTIAVPKA